MSAGSPQHINFDWTKLEIGPAVNFYERQEALHFLNDIYAMSGLSVVKPCGHMVAAHRHLEWTIGTARYEGEIVGTITISRGPPEALPSAQFYDLSLFKGMQIGEISGLAVDRGWRRSRKVWSDLVEFAIRHAQLEFMVPHVIASVHPRQVATYCKDFQFFCVDDKVVELDSYGGAKANLIGIDFRRWSVWSDRDERPLDVPGQLDTATTARPHFHSDVV